MLCTICQYNEAIEEDNICMDCFEAMADDMAYSQDPQPAKGKCYFCNISTIHTTVCVACLDSGAIPF